MQFPHYRIGNGYDIHRLVQDRKLVLGGIEIPYEKGLLGHSDADVLTHAIMDALLGAASLGDIGIHFPPDDTKYKDINSLELLKKVEMLITEKKYRIINIDAVIQAEKPKLSGYVGQMKIQLAKILGIEAENISIKATTMEGLGEIGQGNAIAAMAVVLLEKYIG